jgi:hypothetical protein
MVSVLLSVADPSVTKPLPLKRFGMEAEVGIELLYDASGFTPGGRPQGLGGGSTFHVGISLAAGY